MLALAFLFEIFSAGTESLAWGNLERDNKAFFITEPSVHSAGEDEKPRDIVGSDSEIVGFNCEVNDVGSDVEVAAPKTFLPCIKFV